MTNDIYVYSNIHPAYRSPIIEQVCVRFTYLHSFYNLPTCTLNFKGFALILLKHILKIR